MDHAIGFVVHGISHTIAITSELIAGQKGRESSEARNAVIQREDGTTDIIGEENLTEEAWELDEAVDEISPTSERPQLPEGAEHVSQYFIDEHQNSLENPDSFISRPLPMAVILPQRRPKDRHRGFIRAYAPILGEYSGISQDMFLDFLNNWDKVSRASPIFDVVNMACFGVGMIPNHIAIAVSVSVGTVASVAKEIQGRYRSNKYLVKINEDLFKPRGLVAMIMAYKPEMPDDLLLRADTTDPTKLALTKVLDTENSSKLKRVLNRLKASSGCAQGDAQVPDPAPLIYPSLDLALTSTSLTKTSVFKKNAAVVQDYLDRRAQVDFITSNPSCKLAAALPPPKKPFVNRYCDPDHPVNNGSVFGLLTGGTFDPVGMGRVWRAEAKAKKNREEPLSEGERHDALMGRKVRGRVTGTPSKTVPVLSKMLKRDVLYLVIVNRPTDEDLARVERSAME